MAGRDTHMQSEALTNARHDVATDHPPDSFRKKQWIVFLLVFGTLIVAAFVCAYSR